MVAAFRGRATAKPGAVCHDEWAAIFAGEDGLAHADAYQRTVPDIELWVALRTARLDDAARAAMDRGLTQVVILGAGLDTRAARLARPGVRFFEVDIPTSQREKRRRLAEVAELARYPVDAATYVETDFEHDDFFDRLVASGFDPNEPAFFLWEGVTYYLTEAAVRATLVRLATAASPASVVLFDYFGARFVKGEMRDEMDRSARDKVAEMGEPLKFGTSDVLPFLYECGFRKVRTETFDAIALNYTGTYDRSRKFRFQALAFASRTGEVG